MENINKAYKDSVFSLLFGKPDELRELYNAIANTNYGADVQVSINTLTDALYMNRINDISFTINHKGTSKYSFAAILQGVKIFRVLLHLLRPRPVALSKNTLNISRAVIWAYLFPHFFWLKCSVLTPLSLALFAFRLRQKIASF